MDINDMDYEGERFMEDKSIGEEIRLDKIRHIKYTIKGLKIIAKKCGSVVKAFNDMQTMDANFTVETMDNLVILLHAGLIHEDSKLTADDVENLLTMSNMTTVFNAIIKAFNGSTPEPTEDGGGNDDPGERLSTSIL